ncbi:MAG: hypothetical protein A2W93_13735 [Bacteroidetes bacterium GWF2_43_63]|nr:MAG: hypothetical protein A2W94_03930 [Bacteroidetes bacterium GWE2_42_42]OFY55050.1 MAG: hypothetical protein A2W93_13735 [Bacteroidetes bacterium GWF2_43_63]HBG69587.1 hypothetical protein [Bacteroidales bacterium]HCB60674.1 hypothetical protein [Bacteroidales bacterium]HCY24022.1 hypothetical protein [Bacteroidales bacterium]
MTKLINRIVFAVWLTIIFSFAGTGQNDAALDSLLEQAAEERRNGAYDKALNLDFTVLALAKKMGNEAMLAAANNGIATDYMRIGDLKKSRSYYEQALVIYRQLRDTINIGDQYYKLGSLDVDEGKMDFAREKYSLSVAVFRKNNYYPGLADVYNGFAAMFYVEQNLDSVAFYAEQSLKYYRLAGNTDAESFMYINLGALFNAQKNHSKAIQYVSRGIELADSSGLINQLRQGYKNLGETYAMMGDWKQAYENQLLYIRYNDSIFNQQKNESMVKYEALYQTSEKERKIQEQKTDLLQKESRIKSIRNTRNILIFLFVFAVVIALFFVYRISTRKKINRLLDEKNKQLEEVNAFKDRLFAIISHDLRSPVTSFSRITSALNTAVDKLPPQEIKKYLNDIEISATELQNMLRGLLHWSLTQQSGAKVVTAPVLLSDCIHEAVADCHGAMNEKQILLKTDIPEKINVMTDRGLLHIAFRNVLSNAVKFSNAGNEISVCVTTENSSCFVDIRDQGPGIKDEVAARLFGEMAPDAPSRGGGFGLFISAELLKKMNSNIHLASTSSEGSVFRIILPLAHSS